MVAIMSPTIGRTVHYRLSAQDAEAINRRRHHSEANMPQHREIGVQVHVGNTVREGDVCAMVVTQVWADSRVNGQCILDGTDTYWATSVGLGDVPGTWCWPERV